MQMLFDEKKKPPEPDKDTDPDVIPGFPPDYEHEGLKPPKRPPIIEIEER